MKKIIALAILFISLASAGAAQTLGAGEIDTNGEYVNADMSRNIRGGTISLSGTWTGTVEPQCLTGTNNNNLTANQVYITSLASPFSPTNSITANGFFSFVNIGCRKFRITATDVMTGTLVVVITEGTDNGSGGSGGGGGGSYSVGSSNTDATTIRTVESLNSTTALNLATIASWITDNQGHVVVDALPGAAATCTNTRVGDATSSAQLLAADADAKSRWFTTEGTSGSLFYVKFGTTAANNDYNLILWPNDYKFDFSGYVGRVDVIASAAASDVIVAHQCK